MKKKRYWLFIIHVLMHFIGLSSVLGRIKLIRWLLYTFFCTPTEKYPYPDKFWDKVLWYKTRFIVVLTLYRWLSAILKNKKKDKYE